jgi:hypothetical protein
MNLDLGRPRAGCPGGRTSVRAKAVAFAIETFQEVPPFRFEIAMGLVIRGNYASPAPLFSNRRRPHHANNTVR